MIENKPNYIINAFINNHVENENDYPNYFSRNEQAVFKRYNLISLPKNITSVAKLLCKIYASLCYASGFLIKFDINKEEIYFIISNKHVIKDNLIKRKEKITFLCDNETKYKVIHLNFNKRNIKHFLDIGIDATVVQILNEDNISKDYYLKPNMDYINNYQNLIGQYISIVQYPKGKLNSSDGQIIRINMNLLIWLVLFPDLQEVQLFLKIQI